MGDNLSAVSLPQHPTKYADLYEVNARLGQQVNVIGVVVDTLPPSRTRGSDFQFSLTLQDPISWLDDSYFNHMVGGLRVKFFKPDLKDFPRVQSVGDVILLRGLNMKQHNGNTMALSGWGTHWTVFPGKMMPSNVSSSSTTSQPLAHWSSRSAPLTTPEEQAYAVYLRQWSLTHETLRMRIEEAEATAASARPVNSSSPLLPGSAASGINVNHGLSPVNPAPARNRLIHLSEASEGRFCDIVAEVIKVFEIGLGKEIYITDYTENNQFFHYAHPDGKSKTDSIGEPLYGDAHGYLPASRSTTSNREWPGPWGQFVLCVTLFSPHASVDLKEHDLVSIRNLRIASSKTGSNLEGKLHEDRRRPNQIDIQKVQLKQSISGPTEANINGLRERKEEYWRKYGKGTKPDKIAAKSKAEIKKARKLKNEERKREAQAASVAAGHTTLFPMNGGIKNNQYITCAHPSKPILPLDSIASNANRLYTASNGVGIDLPFINMDCRAHLRVVDFHPPSLEDFTQPIRYSRPADSDDEEPVSSQQSNWKWAFYLLVEDAATPINATNPQRLPLLVAGDAAEFLLDLDATNLRQDTQTLKRLKYRLSILWGNLDEVKARRNNSNEAPKLSNTPFYCCVQEYGVRIKSPQGVESDWRYMHRMVQTKIQYE